MQSPFEHLLNKSSIPFVFQEQFLFSADAPYSILLDGKMDRVWHQPTWLWPLFWLLAWFNILFPETGTDIQASMQIIGGRDQWNMPFHKWNRTFSFSKVHRYFNAVMVYDTQLQAVTERMGPMGLIQMQWCIEFLPPDQIKISTTQCYMTFGKVQMRLPTLLYPSVCVIERAMDNSMIHVDLTVSHPWLGAIFGYDGKFQATRVRI